MEEDISEYPFYACIQQANPIKASINILKSEGVQNITLIINKKGIEFSAQGLNRDNKQKSNCYFFDIQADRIEKYYYNCEDDELYYVFGISELVGATAKLSNNTSIKIYQNKKDKEQGRVKFHCFLKDNKEIFSPIALKIIESSNPEKYHVDTSYYLRAPIDLTVSSFSVFCESCNNNNCFYLVINSDPKDGLELIGKDVNMSSPISKILKAVKVKQNLGDKIILEFDDIIPYKCKYKFPAKTISIFKKFSEISGKSNREEQIRIMLKRKKNDEVEKTYPIGIYLPFSNYGNCRFYGYGEED